MSRERGGRDSGRGSERGGRSGSDRGGRSSYKYQSRKPEDLKKRGDQSGNDFDKYLKDVVKMFKVESGDNIIRFLPPTWDDPEHFGMDIYVHYAIGPDNQTYLCANKMKGEDCPICEERARAQKSGDEDYAKKLEPKKRVLVYLVDRNNEKEGVQAWAMPWTVDRDICKVSVDKRTGDTLELDNPEDGYDVEFEKKGAKDRTEYLGVAVSRRSSPLGDDSWLDFALDNPLDSILNYFSYDHIQQVFGGGHGGDDHEDKKHSASRHGRDKDLDAEQEEGLRESESKGRSRSSSKSRDQEYTWESIHGMTYDEMCAVVEDQNIGIDPEESKDDDDLADWICEEMNIKQEEKHVASRRGSTPKEVPQEESARDRLARLRKERG